MLMGFEQILPIKECKRLSCACW